MVSSKYFRNILYFVFTIILSVYNISCVEAVKPIDKNYFYGGVASDYGTVIIRPDGSLWAEGYNFNLRSEDGITFTKLDNTERFNKLTMSNGACISADADGNIWYSGSYNVTSFIPPKILIPQKIGKLDNISNIDFGWYYPYTINLVKSDGSLWYFPLDPANPTKFQDAVEMTNLKNIKSVSQTLALKTDGTLCESYHWEPILGGLVDIKDVISLQNVAHRRTVVLKNDGTVWAWGQNTLGELGNGTLVNSAIPTQTLGLTDIVQISAHYDFNLALKKNGTVYYWGFMGYDANNGKLYDPVPQKIEEIDNVVFIYAGTAIYYMIKNDGAFGVFYPNTKTLKQIKFKE
jgi:alpha-tubulin suppressor-like RCC1 family protein